MLKKIRKNIPILLTIITIWVLSLMSVFVWFSNTLGANIIIMSVVFVFTFYIIFILIKENEDSSKLKFKNEMLLLCLISTWAFAIYFIFISLSSPVSVTVENIGLRYLIRNTILLTALSIGTIFVILKVLRKNDNTNTDILDNKRMSIFSVNFWKQSTNELRDLKNLIFISILLAIMIGSRAFQIPTGFGPLQWRWSFIPWAIGGFLFGPITGIVMGLIYDVVAFYLFPGTFPFMVTFMSLNLLRGFTYGIILYKAKISFSRLFVLMFIITIPINTIGGALAWAHMMSYDNTVTFAMFRDQLLLLQLPRNVMVFVPQLALLIATFERMLPVLKSSNLLNDYPFYDEQVNII